MDDPAALEIWLVARHPVGESEDVRPCVVLSLLTNGKFEVASISAALDLRGASWQHFAIPSEHPDFPATGLTKSCYVLGYSLGTVRPSQLIKRKGKLQGQLAKAFQDWI
jgi:hypothetical protein